MRINDLSGAVRYALAATAALGAGLLPSGTAGAQEADGAQAATTLDRIEVTGSRIRQVDIESAAPVLSINRDDIEKQGFQSVSEILQNISAAGGPTISRAQPLAAGPNPGGAFISLRNLAPQQTLILINGKRLGINIAGLQDVSTIPTAMIERIEVLKDGASSVYGSDAIAGVINIITRSNFDGAMATAYYGQYDEGDGAITRGDFVLGFGGDRGSLTAAVEYTKEDPVFSRDRPYSAFPQSDRHPTRNWTTVSQWGVINLPSALGGNRVLDTGADWRNIANYHAQDCDTGGTAPTLPARCRASQGAGSTVDKSNPNEQTHLRTPLETRSLFVDGSFDISDAIRFRADVLYNERDSVRQIAGYPLQSATITGPFAGLKMAADSYYNPVGTWHGFAAPQAVDFWRRTWEVPRETEAKATTWRFASGFDGSFEIGSRYFDWDVGYLYNNNKVVQLEYGNVNLANLARAVGPSFLNGNGVVQCGTPSNPIPLGNGPGQCVPWNPFIPFGRVGDGGLTGNDVLRGFLFPELHNTGETETTVFTANLAGALATLPAGDLGFALGVETRKEEGEFVPDALAVNGFSSTLASGPTRGSYSVDEVYAELLIPVLSEVPGAHELSFSLASRYSDYDTFGDTSNSKFGFKWKPIDSLLVRGTWAEGFRAPTIANLFGGGTQTFAFFTDPCDTSFGASRTNAEVRARCARDIANADTFRQLAQGFVPAGQSNSQTPVPFFNTSTPDLQPETSESKTLGLVWSPDFVEGLNVSLDWWNIRVENTIVNDTPTQLLNDCYIQNDPLRCRDFTRDPTRGFVNTLTFALLNAGYRETEGFDLELGYRKATDFGNFTVNWQSSYTSRDELKTDTNPVTPPVQLVGYATAIAGVPGTFRIRSTLSTGWTRGAFGASWNARYFSSMKENCLSAALFPEECNNPDFVAVNPGQSGPKNKVGSNTFHDVQLRWNAPWNATVSIGANNVFDHVGPVMYSQPNANVSYQGQFDIGRFVYMRYQQRF